MAKHTQTTIRLEIVNKLFEHVWPLCEVEIWWHYTICVALKNIGKASSIFSVCIYILYIYSVNTMEKQCSTWKYQKTSSNELSLKFHVQKLHFEISVTEDPPA